MHADREKAERRSPRTRPYPLALRESAVEAAQEGLAAGRSLTSLAREMQLPLHTLQRWLARHRPAFRPVTITTGVASGSRVAALVLHTVHGHRLEGLDVASAITVLRALESAG